MITAQALIGKLVSFIVDKTVGKILELPFDKRRKACRSLTKLYYSVQALDDITENFLKTLKHFEDSGNTNAVIYAINNHSYYLELASNMFIELGQELEGGLEIIDPALARCCHSLYISKFDFLTFISQSIHWDRSGEKSKIIIKSPQGIMESVDLDSLYSDAKQALASGEKFYWPSSALSDFRKDFQEVSLSFEDDNVAKEIKDKIIKQNRKLKEAKEKLRNLIKNSFSIEEVLFQNNSHPYR